MSAVEETSKRLLIAKRIAASLPFALTVYLGGSMGYGQNVSVTEKSDIDLVIVIEKKDLPLLLASWYYSGQIPYSVAELFFTEKINMFWGARIIDGVKVNPFVYAREGFEKFVLLEGDLDVFIQEQPTGEQPYYGFDGVKKSFQRTITRVPSGFIMHKPSLVDDSYWGNAPRLDFLYSADILYERNNYFSLLEKKFWKTIVGQLFKESNDQLNLAQKNILNSHWVYRESPGRLPKSVQEKIVARTVEELLRLS